MDGRAFIFRPRWRSPRPDPAAPASIARVTCSAPELLDLIGISAAGEQKMFNDNARGLFRQ